jgi:GR25 family glycosyltransferase involved in LPS biosynthesis
MIKNINKFYYINLDRREDRRKHLLNEIKKSNILQSKMQRYCAVDGLYLNPETISEQIISNRGKEAIIQKKIYLYGVTLTYGSAACAISHYALFKNCADSNDGNILILEDDIVIDSKIDNYLYIIDNCNIDYDIFYLGYHSSGKNTKIDCIDEQYEICSLGGVFWGGFAYILTPKACQFIVDNVFPISKQFDSEINDRVRQKKIKTLCFKKKIIKCGQFGSDNQGKNGLINKRFTSEVWNEVFTKY